MNLYRNFITHQSLSLLLTASIISGYAWGADTTNSIQKLPTIDVQITLSPKAKATLEQGKEGIIAFAEWYGWPTEQGQKHASENGQLSLGQEKVTISGQGGTAHFSPQNIKVEELNWLKGPVYININAASARHHWHDNILNCDFVDGIATDIGHHPVTLHCALISEGKPSKVVDH